MKNKSRYVLNKYNVLIIGDLMLDRYLYGNISRISPEAPVPVLEKVNVENKPGGAANVAPVSYTHLTLPTSDLV